ncbi:hypothetical protein ACC695_40185, partial [Rhizobium ruizarguesonis]
ICFKAHDMILAGLLLREEEGFELLHVGAGKFPLQRSLPALLETDGCIAHLGKSFAYDKTTGKRF